MIILSIKCKTHSRKLILKSDFRKMQFLDQLAPVSPMIEKHYTKFTDEFVKRSSINNGEQDGVEVVHRTPNRGVLGSIPTYGTVLCP